MAVLGAQEPAVGARVLLGGQHRATVRYVGPVEGQQGTWVGIEYDEAGRGKHDGSHGGRRYFSCSYGASAGSLVRLGKFMEVADFGQSLVAAARQRYGLEQQAGSAGQPAVDGSTDELSRQLYMTTASNRRIAVEVLAKEAPSRRLSGSGAAVAVLVRQRISTLGPSSELQATLPSLTELDLSDNLIASWRFVAELATALPSLTALNLSVNRLALPGLSAALPAPAPCLPGLQVLVLNSCGVTWQQAVAVAQQLPNLRELHLCGNAFRSLQLPAQGVAAGAAAGTSSLPPGSGADGSAAFLAAAFQHLELLDLENNQLSSWADVTLLRQLPRLTSLLLSGNQLSNVEYDGGFTSLRALMLGGNQLSSWQAASQLDAFPALQEARLSDNPLTVATPGSARYQCIARISRLTVLNASTVSPAERWDAEVNYLRQVTDELAEAGADEAARQQVLAQHPRFDALVKRYGELAPAAPKTTAGSALAASMVQLTICHSGKTLQKKLPVSLTVGKLKVMLERLLRVKATQQALLLVPPEDSEAQPEDIGDDEGRELRYYDVADGWRLEVGMSDPAARTAALAAAKAAAAAAHAARMEQHEKAIQQFRAVEQRLMA